MRFTYLLKSFAVALVAMSAVACYDHDSIWDELDQVKDEMAKLENRVDSLEQCMKDNVSAIQSMVSLGSIKSWAFDAESGKGVITLADGKTITINQSITGYSVITVEKGEDGKYYWAICRDGVNLPLTIDNKKVPVSVTPALKISKDNEWMISVDGGATWVKTGITYNASDDSQEEAVVFEGAEVDGDYLIITLVGGTEIKVAIAGEAMFKADADTLWFSRAGLLKSVAVQMQNVKAYTITEKPEGWKASFDESYLFVKAPVNFVDFPKQGTVKVFALFDNAAMPEILQLEVIHEPMFTLTRANGVVSVKLSQHTADDFTGYVLIGMPKDEYSVETVCAKLNAEYESLTVRSGSETYELGDIIDGYVKSKEYVVAAVPYLPASQVAQGSMKYEISDIVSVETIAEEGGWEITNLRYDSALLHAVMDVPEYYGGFMEKDRWDAVGKDDMLELLKAGNLTSVTDVKYDGPVNGFPDGEAEGSLNPATEYVIWYMPVKNNTSYTASMFVEFTFTTPDVVADNTIAAPDFEVSDVTASGFTAKVTPKVNAYKTYSTIAKSVVLPETEVELVRYLVSINNFSEGNASNTVSKNAFDPSDEVYLLAVSMTEDGKYGKVLKEKVALKNLVFTDDLGVEVTAIEYDSTGSATLSLSFKGSPVTLTYMAASFTFYTDEVIEDLMAKGQMGDAKTVEISKIDGKVTVTDLELGVEHIFYALVTDAQDRHSHLYCTYTFTPTLDVEYVKSSDPDYNVAKPTLSGSFSGSGNNKKYKLTVTKPDDCKKYWLFCGDPEYMRGDVYQDTDKMIMMGFELLGETVHEDSATITYERVNADTRIYMVWLDSQDRHHCIYEFNPNN